jgi:FAD/FMN-containing dehydrogenase
MSETEDHTDEEPTEDQETASSRREFLAGAGTASVAAVGAVLATCALRGIRLPAHPSSASSRVAFVRPASTTAKPTRADWTALRKHLSARKLVRPGDLGYGQARKLYQPRFDSLEPAAVAYCHTVADVASCLSFARKFRTAVRVRSGGHSLAGWSTVTGGLVIDVSAMNAVSFGDKTVTVGAGLDLINFHSSLAARSLAVPAAASPTVGIAGLALGGGLGALSRLHGTTSDNLVAIQLVMADGSAVSCDDTQNSDVLWACRGGGGGNFGVATSLTFGTHDRSELCVYLLTWPWPDAARVVSAWQCWAPDAPDELRSILHLSADFGSSPSLGVGGTYAGPAHALARHLDYLYHLVGSAPATAFARQESYLDAMLVEAGCSAIPIEACHTGPGGQLARVPSFARSDFFTAPLPRGGIRALLAGLERIRGINGAAGGAGVVAFDALGGAVNRVPAQATAFVHRDALFLAQYSTSWTSPGEPSGVNNQHAWLNSCYRSLHRHASGQAYQNYVDPDLRDWRRAYYGANYPWLKLVKTTVDPANIFQFPQSIRPG